MCVCVCVCVCPIIEAPWYFTETPIFRFLNLTEGMLVQVAILK